MINRVELLAPAGDLERAKIAIDYKADAVYFGGKLFSLRARASNFDIYEINQLVDYAHKRNAKVYEVLNIIGHNIEPKTFEEYFKKIRDIGLDGYIVADPFIINQIKRLQPNAVIHISTQQSVCNSKAAKFFAKNGASRIVCSRELDYKNLKKLSIACNGVVELEYFIHGAICVSFSGRCMMSNNFTLRDANVGDCAQPCRWNWKVIQNNKIGKQNFSMSTKDNCQLLNIDKLLKLNITSFKVEGRMKSLHYLATTINCYRKMIDACLNNKKSKSTFNKYHNEIKKAVNRPIGDGWFNGTPDNNKLLFESTKKLLQSYVFVVNKQANNKSYEVTSKNYFTIDDEFEIMGSNHENIKTKIKKIIDLQTNEITNAVNKPMRKYLIEFKTTKKLFTNDIGRSI